MNEAFRSVRIVLLYVNFMMPATHAKRANERIATRETFVRNPTRGCHINGMGRSASRKSVAMLTAELKRPICAKTSRLK
jgi:hypothetical protein